MTDETEYPPEAGAMFVTAGLDVARLLSHLDRPVMVFRFARARGDQHRGARRTRENAEAEIKRIIALHLVGMSDVIERERTERRRREEIKLRRRHLREGVM